MSSAAQICSGCGAPMEIYFIAEHDKAARCTFCGQQVDLPDDVQFQEVEETFETTADGGQRSTRRVTTRYSGGAGASSIGFDPGARPLGAKPQLDAARAMLDQLNAHSVRAFGQPGGVDLGSLFGPGMLVSANGLQSTSIEFSSQRPGSQPAATAPLSWTVALTLSVFFGWFGADRFYLGQPLLGILKALSFGACGMWWIADVLLLLLGGVRDGHGRPLER